MASIYKSSTVVLIGNGAWSLKLREVIQNTTPMKVSIFSARELLSNNIKKNFNYPVWITTRPKNQLKLIESISAPFIILEKPLFSDQTDFDKFESITEISRENLVFSNLWSHSEVWSELKSILAPKTILAIQIHRYGNNRRSYISPIQDWLPHDLNLLSELFDYRQIEKFRRVCGDKNYATFKISLKGGNQITWQGGYNGNLPAVSLWIVKTNEETIKVDFKKASISVEKFGNNDQFNYEITNTIPLFLNNLESKKITENQKSWQYFTVECDISKKG